MKNTLFQSIHLAAIFLPSLITVLTFRGFFRAFMAKLMGDNTPQEEGFLTLNPVAHVDLVGILVILFVLFVVGGLLPGGVSHALLLIFLIFMGARWSYEVPFNERNFRSEKTGMLMMSLAGFIGNCLLALLFLYVRKYFPFERFSLSGMTALNSIFVAIVDFSIFFGIFNLLPIPPFDGAILLSYLLPASSYNILRWLEEHALFILIGLLLFGDVFFSGINVLGMLLKSLLIKCVF